ncbi:hypothetical protein PENTCL1PPCAC_10181, partial [Pristionchus entomophagus]
RSPGNRAKCQPSKELQDTLSKQEGDLTSIINSVAKCGLQRPAGLDDVLAFSTLFNFALSSFVLGFFVHARNPLFI